MLEIGKNLKMDQRIQPNRQAKKKRKMEAPESFDLVGNLLGNYGLTGENLAHQIFSYLDFSSIQDSRLVCKSWNLFLRNNKKIWLQLLRQTQPFFEFLSNQFQDGFSTIASEHQFSSNKHSVANDTKKPWLKEFFDSIEIRAKNDNFSCQKMIHLFRKSHVVHAALQSVIQDCPVYEVFQREFIGRQFAEEIQSEIFEDYPQKSLHLNRFRFESRKSFLPWLQRKIVILKDLQEHLQEQEDIFLEWGINYDQDLFQSTLDDIQRCQRELLRGIEIEFNTVFLKVSKLNFECKIAIHQ